MAVATMVISSTVPPALTTLHSLQAACCRYVDAAFSDLNYDGDNDENETFRGRSLLREPRTARPAALDVAVSLMVLFRWLRNPTLRRPLLFLVHRSTDIEIIYTHADRYTLFTIYQLQHSARIVESERST